MGTGWSGTCGWDCLRPRTLRPPRSRRAGASGVEAYEGIWTKAGALLQSLAMNHALLDGNKRLAWVATRVFLDLNDVPPVVVDVDQAEPFVIQIVTHDLDPVEEVAKGLVALYADGASRQ